MALLVGCAGAAPELPMDLGTPDGGAAVDLSTPPEKDAGAQMDLGAPQDLGEGLDMGMEDLGPPPPPPPPPPFEGCPGSSQAHQVFNELWSTFDAEYAVFDLRLPGGSWDEVGREGCAQISAGMSDNALYDVLIGMARRLDDGHVQLTADDLGRDEDGWVSIYPYYEELYSLESNVEDEYLDGDLTYAAEDEISWGRIGNIGYVSITSMDALSQSEDEDDDRAAARAAMARAMSDLQGVLGMVVDVRANEGGWDTVSLDIASYFAGPRALAWSKRRRAGPAHDDFGPPEDTFVEAAVNQAFNGPVVLLTSGGTFSAAETFALAMRVRSNVSILGERSSGHFSDLIDGELVNGWSFTYSGERYQAADGSVYEAQGVPVDVQVPLNVQALSSGQDVMLEAALMLLP